ncbi:MAG: ABC transporter permease [Bacteroidia bacterium]|nr:ABC transporter permease [Bacteroidia bacterium]
MESDKWDIEVDANKSGVSLQLNQLWRYRDLLILFIKRDFSAQYKQTVLGPLWFLLQPVLTAAAYSIVFGLIAGISTGGYPRVIFYLSGVTCWMYFADCVNKTGTTFVTNSNLFSKVYFPRLIVPISVVVSSMMRFLIQSLLLAGFILYYNFNGTSISPNIYVVMIPVLVLLMAVIGLGAGLLISSLTTKYRDLQYLVQFGITLMMYFSPVIFPLSSVKHKWLEIIISMNPMTFIIETFRYAVLGQDGPYQYWTQLGWTSVFAVVLLTIALLVFNRVQRSFMDTV